MSNQNQSKRIPNAFEQARNTGTVGGSGVPPKEENTNVEKKKTTNTLFYIHRQLQRRSTRYNTVYHQPPEIKQFVLLGTSGTASKTYTASSSPDHQLRSIRFAASF